MNEVSEDSVGKVSTENTGNTVEDIQQEEAVETPVTNEKDISTGAYKPLQIEINPVTKDVPDIPEINEDEKKEQAKVVIFSQTDSKFFAQMIWNMPPAIFGDYMQVNEKLVATFGEQLFSYCERKGLNPYDYLFDELGIVLATGAICMDLGMKYKAHKKEEEEKEEKK